MKRALGYFLRTVVPYLNVRAGDPSVRFERRYLLMGTALYLICLYTAMTTVDALPGLIQASLGGTFLAYLLLAVASIHVVFEAMDKARAPRTAAPPD